MKWRPKIWVCQGCILLCTLWGVFAELGNPYEILGVHSKATQQEIRKAYKQLVKEWHPDKTNDPRAEERFVDIKLAYELLSDPDRRRRYDDKGITEDDFYKKVEHPSFHANSPFDDIFVHNGAHFNFQENDITFFHKLSVTTKQFDKIIVPKSDRVPHLIFFYADWCFSCIQTAPYCRKLVDYLEPLGINFVTVHTGREPNLNRRLSIHKIPCLVLLLDGNAYVYKEDSIMSIQKIIDFIRSKMPYKMVRRVGSSNIDEFLNGWEDNRVRGLIFEPKSTMRLRYLVTAYHFRHRVAFGFVDSEDVRKRFQIPNDMDAVLMFNENTSYPMASVTMKDIPTSTLNHIISSNQYLALPRLSSQSVLEALCPCEWNKPRKKLCVVLVTSKSSSHDSHRQSFRLYAQKSPYNTEKVRFAYIYHDMQTQFVNSLIPEQENLEPLLHIVILWRRDTSHVKYEWVEAIWEVEKNLNDTTSKLESTLTRLLKSSETFSYEAFVKDLFDEHAKGMIGRIVGRVVQYVEQFYDGLGKEQILPALSLLGTIVFILGIGYFMAYLVRLEEESIQKEKARREARKTGNNNNPSYEPELKLHELRSETNNALVRLLKPGCRTIVLVLDMQSAQQLIPPFHKAVWPYRKNKTLMFSYMYIERGLKWYKQLLTLSLPDETDLNINPRNCVGTVLSLNGHRKYFCVFHAKHPEKKKKKVEDSQKGYAEHDLESGAFIGFDSDSSDSDDEDILMQGTLLNGFSNWLDRLFEGTTQRFRINYWPEFPIK